MPAQIAFRKFIAVGQKTKAMTAQKFGQGFNYQVEVLFNLAAGLNRELYLIVMD